MWMPAGIVPVRAADIGNDTETIAALGQRIRAKQASPVAVVRACLARIDAFNDALNAFITVLADQALEQARTAEAQIHAGKWLGPLHGIPVGVKDFYDTAEIRTTAAFEPFADRVPKQDAIAVAKLKQAGAIIVGKTNMHRLGMGTTGLESSHGPVRNPWNADYIAGGSSAGSAAAVASGMCYATLDTDAIGSCRLPAACCGVVGFKGTYGLIDTNGILAGEQDPGEMIRWFNHAAIMARTVDDVAIVLDVLAEGRERREARYFVDLGNASNVRVGIAVGLEHDDDVMTTFERAVEDIRRVGWATTDATVPLRAPDSGIDTIRADRQAIADHAFNDIDVLVLPTTATTVPTIKEALRDPQALSARNTAFANYYGLPAISVPCGFDRSGLPLGVQFVGRPWDELTVLRVARRYEQSRRTPTAPASSER